MTSQINPNNIDGNYPVAGVPNNTQGFRDNFTNTKTNFQYAADEIDELQTKAVLKAALDGTTLDNNLNDNIIYAAQLRDISYSQVTLTQTAGSVNLDFAAGNFQVIPGSSGSVSLSFSNWPAAGTVGVLRFAFVCSNTTHTLTLPASVRVGVTGIQGISPGTAGVSNTITFDNATTYNNVYIFEFTTDDAGTQITIQDLIRPKDVFGTRITADANIASTNTATGSIVVTGAGGVGVAGNINAGGSIRSVSATAGIGYSAGSGGAETQLTNKGTGVTLNKITGQLTLNNATLNSDTSVSFTLTNSAIANTDVMIINHVSGGTIGAYTFNAVCGAGNASITVRNITAGNLSEAVVIRYAVIKAAIS
jgi:hypothetical protein